MQCSVKYKILSAIEEVEVLKSIVKKILMDSQAPIEEILVDFQVFFNQENPNQEQEPMLLLKLTWIYDYSITSELDLMDFSSMRDISIYDLEHFCEVFCRIVGKVETQESEESAGEEEEEDFVIPLEKKGFFSKFKKKKNDNPFL